MYNHKDGIALRKLSRGDLELLLTLKEESWWGTHDALFANLEDQVAWFESLPKTTMVMMACKHAVNIGYYPVGVAVYTDIHWINRSLNISGSILKNHRGTPLVKEAFSAGLDFAFEMLNMRRVQAEVLISNAPAQALEIDHLGFTVEGCRRSAIYKSGRYYDSVVMGMLRDEWASSVRVFGYGDCCNLNFSHEVAERVVKNYERRYEKTNPDESVVVS